VLAILFALGTAVSWGINPLFARRAMLKVDVVTTNFYGIIAGLIAISAFSFFAGDLESLPGIRPEQFLTFAVVGILTIALGRTMYYVSITRVGAGRSISIVASSVLVASVVAIFALNEAVDFKTALGIVLVFAGVCLIARREE